MESETELVMCEFVTLTMFKQCLQIPRIFERCDVNSPFDPYIIVYLIAINSYGNNITMRVQT